MTDTGRPLLIVGAGGHAKVIIDVARSAGWAPIALFDRHATGQVSDVPIVGNDSEVERYLKSGICKHLLVAIGNNQLRLNLSSHFRSLGATTPMIAHSSAVLSPYSSIEGGTVILPGAIVNAGALVGKDVIINSNAVVEHDCILEFGCHIAPGTVLGGTCKVGSATLVGLGSSVRPGTVIGANAVVGAGSIVVRDVADGETVKGVPAR